MVKEKVDNVKCIKIVIRRNKMDNETKKDEIRKSLSDKIAKRNELDAEIEVAEKLDDEVLQKKLTELTVGEFLDILGKGSTSVGGLGELGDVGGMGGLMESTMKMMENNPSMFKNMMKMMGMR